MPTSPVRRSPYTTVQTSPQLRSRRRLLQLTGGAVLSLLVGQGRSALSQSVPIQVVAAPIKVGLLRSLSGVMAIAESDLLDAEQLAIAEINQAGGVLGRQIEPVIEDYASDWSLAQQQAEKLIRRDRVATIFGCLTSASRKSVLPVIKKYQHLLWYAAAYEGQECSQNIFYTGTVPNQQIEPTLEWFFNNRGKNFYLIGSDYVYPRTVNTIIKARLEQLGGTVVGETYVPLGFTDTQEPVRAIQQTLPQGGIIYNSLTGDSNHAFFVQLSQAGLNPTRYPCISTNMTELEIPDIGARYLQGHYLAESYFQTLNTPASRKFVTAFKARYGVDRRVSAQMANAYTSVYLWKQAVETAKTPTNLKRVRSAAIGQSFEAPEGWVTLTNSHHSTKWLRIGQIQADGQVGIIHQFPQAISPEPWNSRLSATKDRVCNWS